MSSTLREILLPAFAECLVLTGLHAYLGLHVLRRQVIFVDLTLAQIAALGITVGLLFGLSTDSPGAYVLSLTFTILGAAIFTVTRMRTSRVPQEAVIGLVYALAAALAILLVAQGPHGAKEVKSIMTGRLLWVDWGTVSVTAVVYGLLGLVHWLFRRPLWKLSNDPKGARDEGMRIHAWDFLFYVTFGVAISLSVRTAGVLLVFVFLVVPAMAALLVSKRPGVQLLVGWTVGTVVTAGGLVLSYAAQLPSGPTVVTFYGLMLVPIAVGVWLWRSVDRRRALRLVGLGATVVAVTVVGFVGLGRTMAGTSWAHGPDAHGDHVARGDRFEPFNHSASSPNGASAPIGEHGVEHENVAEALDTADFLNPEVASALELAATNRRAAGQALLAVLRSDAFPFEKAEAADALASLTNENVGYDANAAPDDEANQAAIGRIERWLELEEDP